MSEPTKGPWHVTGADGEWVNDRREMNICRVNTTVSVAPSGRTGSDGEASRNANAQLIAASPSLLKAAEQLIQTVELYQLNELRQRPYRELKWAVQKARGEQ